MIEILLQFVCEGCLKGFVVRDEDVENELSCPFCSLDVPILEHEDDEDD